MFDSLQISDFKNRHFSVLRKPTSTRPTIWLGEIGGIQAVVKDYSSSRFIFRNTFGRFLVWREAKAYKKAAGLKGVPKLFRVIDGLALVIEAIPGTDLGEAKKQMKIGDDFFDALKDLVDQIHERGLAHCDLKKVGNVLVGQDGKPYLIDWAAAISRSEFKIPFLDMIYERFVLDDYNAITKHKLHITPESVDPEEIESYNRRSWAERAVRTVRDRLRSLLQAVS